MATPKTAEESLEAGSNLLIHIGIPKSGSTFLQEYVFPWHSGIDYWGKFYPAVLRRSNPDQSMVPFMQSLMAAQFSPHRMQEFSYAVAARRAASQSSGKIAVWSSEGLSTGGPIHRGQRARSMREAVGPARILIVIREPLSFIRSMYLQKLREAQTRRRRVRAFWKRFFEIDEWLEASWRNGPIGQISGIDYASTIESFAAAFGREALGIFLFEDLVASQDTFVEALSRYIGVDPAESVRLSQSKTSNPCLSQVQLEKLRTAYQNPLSSLCLHLLTKQTRVRRLGLRDDAPGPKAKIAIPPEWEQRIIQATRQGNRRLSEEWGLPLASRGYIL